MQTKKGEIMWDQLFGWIIAVLILVLVGGVLYAFYTGKIYSLIDFVKNMVRFGR